MTPDKDTGAYAAIAERHSVKHETEFAAWAAAARHRFETLIALGPGATEAVKRVMEAINAELARLTPPHLSAGPASTGF